MLYLYTRSTIEILEKIYKLTKNYPIEIEQCLGDNII